MAMREHELINRLAEIATARADRELEATAVYAVLGCALIVAMLAILLAL